MNDAHKCPHVSDGARAFLFASRNIGVGKTDVSNRSVYDEVEQTYRYDISTRGDGQVLDGVAEAFEDASELRSDRRPVVSAIGRCIIIVREREVIRRIVRYSDSKT